MSDRYYTYQCDNCDFSTDNEEDFPTLSEVHHLGERLDPGSVVPDGECPECGAFVYAAQDRTYRDADSKLMDVSRSLLTLNRAFEADPNAIHALLCNRVPCNQLLADDPCVQVDESPVLPAGNFQVGTLGLINAVLAANGLPLVAARFTDEKTSNGSPKLLGFCEYICEDSTNDRD